METTKYPFWKQHPVLSEIRVDTLNKIIELVVKLRTEGESRTAYIMIDLALGMYSTSVEDQRIPADITDSEQEAIVRLFQEFSIIAYYSDRRDLGLQISDKLLFHRSRIIDGTRERSHAVDDEMIHRNLIFYVDRLPRIEKYVISVEMPLVEDFRYHSMNPSIIRTENGYLFLCRGVNYDLTDGSYHIHAVDQKVRTKNILVRTDRQLIPISQHEIVDHADYTRYPSRVVGFEDCRLFQVGEELWFTCTTGESKAEFLPQIGIGKIPSPPWENTIPITTFVPLEGPSPGRCEKNWLPFACGGQISVIYTYSDTIALLIGMEDGIPDGETSEFSRKVTNEYACQFRGSGGPIPFDDGYLAVIHEVSFPDNVRHYFHRFVWIDDQFKLRKVSPLWRFDDQRIEFCAGLCRSHQDGQLLLSYGVNDNKAAIISVDIDQVRKMLADLPSFSN